MTIGLHAFVVCTGLVALAEIGDKTQLLSLLLAARYRRPWTILAGVAAATLLNHALAAVLGGLLAQALSPQALRWLLGLGFFAMALWALRADRLDEDPTQRATPFGVFGLTALVFFLAEIGDKTQVATVALAVRFDDALPAVVAGTTLGMLLANAPVVFAGPRLLQRLPMAWIRRGTALVFAATGLWLLLVPPDLAAT